MNKRDTTPIIVNGELRVNQKRKRVNGDDFKEPKKNPLLDLLLTLICLGLVGYGAYTMLNKDSKEDNDNKESNSNITSNIESNSNSNSNVKEINYESLVKLTKLESTNLYSKEDLKYMNSINGLDVSNISNNALLSLAAKVSIVNSLNGKSYITEEELDNSVNSLFGKHEYTKRAFKYGKNLYNYNQETKMYYLMEESESNITYSKYDYIEQVEENDILYVRDYVMYTDGAKSWTINNTALTMLITADNMKDNISMLKYYEYKFIKVNDNYILSKISIK